MNSQHIELDISKQDSFQCVTIGQGDSGGTTIEAAIYDNGAPVDLSGCAVCFVALLPDKRHYVRQELAAVESGNVIEYAVDESKVASVAGYTDEAYFTIAHNGREYSTERFALDIKRSALDGQQPAESWDTAVDGIIAASEAAIEGCEQATNDAVKVTDEVRAAGESAAAAETARASAEQDRIASETGRASAEGARASSEAARIAAEGKRATAEQARAKAEGARAAAETGRAQAETGRTEAEAARESAEAKRRADFADIADSAQGLTSRILSPGEYDAAGVPVIEAVPGIIYLVPVQGPPSDEYDYYIEWMRLGGKWEVIGGTKTTIKPMSTDEVDAVLADESPTGTGVMDVTRLSYLWTRLKAAFAPISHRHTGADITDNSIGGAKLATGAITDAKVSANAAIIGSKLADGSIPASKLGDKMLPVFIVSSDAEAVSRTPCLRAVVDASGTLQKLLFDEGGGS